MANETLSVLHHIYNQSEYTNLEVVNKIVHDSLHNEDRDIILQAVRLKVTTRVSDQVSSPYDTAAINAIVKSLAITWRLELAERIVSLFVQAKFLDSYDQDSFTIEGNVLLKFTGQQTHVDIPHGTISISDSAFAWCKNLESITMPLSLTSIGNWTFADCGIKSLIIPKGVTTIGDWAFVSCHNLQSITIPDGVTTIGQLAFAWCESLTSIKLPEGVISIGEKTFERCTSLSSITIPTTVSTIGDLAFAWCSSLENIVIPEGVTSIGTAVFANCYNLTSITIPSTLKTVANKVVLAKSGVIRSGRIWELLTE